MVNILLYSGSKFHGSGFTVGRFALFIILEIGDELELQSNHISFTDNLSNSLLSKALFG